VRKWIIILVAVCLLAGIGVFQFVGQKDGESGGPRESTGRSYTFDGKMSEEVLRSYLSRSIQIWDLFWVSGDEAKKKEWLRFIDNTGVKLIGRAAMIWANFEDDEIMFKYAGEMAKAVHDQDPEIILQAGIFETTAESVNDIPIPDWVYSAFDMPAEKRNFSYEKMLYPDGRYLNNWGEGKSVPDITNVETQLFFFYRAQRYIELGYESIHLGQVKMMGERDEQYKAWNELMHKIRKVGAEQGRRHNVLLDAHINEAYDETNADEASNANLANTNSGNANSSNAKSSSAEPAAKKLSFDFIGYPARMKPMTGFPQETKLEVGYTDAFYQITIGGIHPQGWETPHTPYLIELDNYGGTNGTPGKSEAFWPWGYDEIAWFAHQGDDYRKSWLAYAYDWLKTNDPYGYIQMPGYRTLGHAPVGESSTYNAITPSDAFPLGFADEEAIKAIWQEEQGSGVMNDELNDLTHVYRLSNRLGYDEQRAASFGGDEKRVVSRSGRGEYLIYKSPYHAGDLSEFVLDAWLQGQDAKSELKFSISADDEQYESLAAVKKQEGEGGKTIYTGTKLPKGTRYLKITFPDAPGAAQIGKVTIKYEP